jgi:hypothetical protein
MSAQIDAYCERLGPGVWAEPVNLLTNLAFLLAAAVMTARLRRSAPDMTGHGLAWILTALLAAIGIGSGLWHSFATPWAALSDVLPIAAFILVYVYACHRDMLGWRRWAAAAPLGFIAYAGAAAAGFAAMPFFAISGPYWTVVLALILYAPFVGRRAPALGRGFVIGAGLLALSLTARSLDEILCPALPLGTHFLWHLINAAMLAWMIELYRRHLLAARGHGG